MSSALTTPLKKEHPSALAFDWLLHSGIQDAGENPKTRGGVNAWFDLKDHSYSFLYSEITGYAVSAFLFWHGVTGETSYLRAARQAADWLLGSRYSESGLVQTRLNHGTHAKPYFDSCVFTFDQWVIVYGLANLAEVTRDSVYQEGAERMANFLLKHTVLNNGSFSPMYDVDKRMARSSGEKWSRQPGSFHAKALMALAKLHELTKKSEFRDCALKLAKWTLTLQQEDGRFITQDSNGSTHLHPHLYSLEGLLSVGLPERDQVLMTACDRGLRWVLNHEREDGTIYSVFQGGEFLPYVRADVLAQTLRLAAILSRHGFFNQDKSSLDRLREKLLSYQITEGPQKGGFLYGQEQDGTVHDHVNAWVTMFAGQAVWLYDGPGSGSKPYDMSFFV